MSRKLYAITTGDWYDYGLIGLCSSKKAANNILDRLTAEGIKDVNIREYEDLFFLRDNTYKSYKVKFQTVSDGYKEFPGGTAEEIKFSNALYPDYLIDSEGKPSQFYVFGHDSNEAVRQALKISEKYPKTEPIISTT